MFVSTTKVTTRSGLWRKRASWARPPSSSRSARSSSSRPSSRVSRPPDRTFDRMSSMALTAAGISPLLFRGEGARQPEEGLHPAALAFAQLKGESLQVSPDLGDGHAQVTSHAPDGVEGGQVGPQPLRQRLPKRRLLAVV